VLGGGGVGGGGRTRVLGIPLDIFFSMLPVPTPTLLRFQRKMRFLPGFGKRKNIDGNFVEYERIENLKLVFIFLWTI
jgi:hypothetical protein